MKRTFVNLQGTIRQSASLPDAPLWPYRRYTASDGGLPWPVCQVRTSCPHPFDPCVGPHRASARRPPKTPSASHVIDEYSQSGRTPKIVAHGQTDGIDLLLSDLTMSIMNGQDLAARVFECLTHNGSIPESQSTWNVWRLSSKG